MDFKGILGKYKIIQTEDNTQTLWSEYFDEACHNLSGAYEETLYNYISGCAIPHQMTQDKDIHVLDVGFGVGVGLLALIDQYKKSEGKTARRLSYTSIELDEELFLWSMKNTLPNVLVHKRENEKGIFYEGLANTAHGELKITVYIGDGRITLPAHKKSLPPFSAIFQDAFSPKKNPTLWSLEWFSFLKDVSDEDVRLSTYSSSVSIRKSLIAAGWAIENAKGFGQKRTMTKASLTGITDPALLAELNKSPTLELHDK